MTEYMLIDSNDNCYFVEAVNVKQAIDIVNSECEVDIVDWIYTGE